MPTNLNVLDGAASGANETTPGAGMARALMKSVTRKAGKKHRHAGKGKHAAHHTRKRGR